MQILIVDDEAPARARLARLVTGAGHTVVGEATDGVTALNAVQTLAPQVVLLDVRMPGMDGLEVARHLAALETPPAVVFTTAYDEYALAAFEAAAVAYLLKPVRAERLADALERAARPTRAQLASTRTHLSSRMGDRLLLVPVQSVRCLLADSKYVTARHDEGELVLDETLKALESEFPDRFLRIHRNALVAVAHVDRVEGNQVFLRGDPEPLEVSRRHGAEVRRRLQRS